MKYSKLWSISSVITIAGQIDLGNDNLRRLITMCLISLCMKQPYTSQAAYLPIWSCKLEAIQTMTLLAVSS